MIKLRNRKSTTNRCYLLAILPIIYKYLQINVNTNYFLIIFFWINKNVTYLKQKKKHVQLRNT